MTPEEFEGLLEEEHRLAIKWKKIQEKMGKVKELIHKNCQCLPENRERKYHSTPGGYDYKGEDSSWDQCKICGRTYNYKSRLTGFSQGEKYA